MMVSVTILDLLETVVKRLVAHGGTRLAGLEAIAMQLVVMVGMLGPGLGRPKRDSR